MRKLALLALASILAASFAGCASSLSGSAYERRQARSEHDVQMGVVEHVREVLIEGTKSRVGSTAGAVAGGAIGAHAGGGPGSVGRVVGGVAGAVLGGVGGAAAEEGITRQKGLEITVKLDNGRMIAITQAADEDFQAGDRVRVLSAGRGDSRVTH
jgi:outer membrane lipoprotein SlyB